MSGPAPRGVGRRGNSEFQVFAARLTVFFGVIAAALGVLLASLVLGGAVRVVVLMRSRRAR